MELTKEECQQILPFANALQSRLQSNQITKSDISSFISIVKEILKPKNQNERAKHFPANNPT